MLVSRPYKRGYGWSAIALPVVIGAVLLFSFMPDQVLDKLPSIHVLSHRGNAPCVLSVGGERAQRDAMLSAAESSGLQARFATEAAEALQLLRSEPCRVRAVAIDSGVANQSWLIQELRNTYPSARIAGFNAQTAPEKMIELLPKPAPAKAAAQSSDQH